MVTGTPQVGLIMTEGELENDRSSPGGLENYWNTPDVLHYDWSVS